MSPEIYLEKGHDFLSDWWALGIVMYELAAGVPPFDDEDLERLADKVCFEDFPLKSYFSKDFSNLLLRLTSKSRDGRLGSKSGVAEIKAHPFFKNIDWSQVRQKGLQPPIVPDPEAAKKLSECKSGADLNPYELLANCFDRKIYD